MLEISGSSTARTSTPSSPHPMAPSSSAFFRRLPATARVAWGEPVARTELSRAAGVGAAGVGDELRLAFWGILRSFGAKRVPLPPWPPFWPPFPSREADVRF
jgi:hypothetical protein